MPFITGMYDVPPPLIPTKKFVEASLTRFAQDLRDEARDAPWKEPPLRGRALGLPHQLISKMLRGENPGHSTETELVGFDFLISPDVNVPLAEVAMNRVAPGLVHIGEVYREQLSENFPVIVLATFPTYGMRIDPHNAAEFARKLGIELDPATDPEGYRGLSQYMARATQEPDGKEAGAIMALASPMLVVCALTLDGMSGVVDCTLDKVSEGTIISHFGLPAMSTPTNFPVITAGSYPFPVSLNSFYTGWLTQEYRTNNDTPSNFGGTE